MAVPTYYITTEVQMDDEKKGVSAVVVNHQGRLSNDGLVAVANAAIGESRGTSTPDMVAEKFGPMDNGRSTYVVIKPGPGVG